MSRYTGITADPDGTRSGVPVFLWRMAPEGYATRRQLAAHGLRPGGQPVAAQIHWRGIGGLRFADLYLIDLAKPKRPATVAQLAAIGAALAARRVCPTCNESRWYYIPRSLGECLDCAGYGAQSSEVA